MGIIVDVVLKTTDRDAILATGLKEALRMEWSFDIYIVEGIDVLACVNKLGAHVHWFATDVTKFSIHN
jgi:hypothetical protein